MQNLEITRYHGSVVAVGKQPVLVVHLPDWSLLYIEYPAGEMEDYRNAIHREHISIVKVTKKRIYFET